MLLEEIKQEVILLTNTYSNLNPSLRNKQLLSEGLPLGKKVVRLMKEDLSKACWLILFNKLCQNKGFVVVEVQTTKSVFYSNQFEMFFRFCNKC